LAPTAGILAAAAVNLVGDGVLVIYLGYGLAGAAAATAAASWTGSVMVLARLRRMIVPRFRRGNCAGMRCISACAVLTRALRAQLAQAGGCGAAAGGVGRAASDAGHQLDCLLLHNQVCGSGGHHRGGSPPDHPADLVRALSLPAPHTHPR
jgi:hypothetical protein